MLNISKLIKASFLLLFITSICQNTLAQKKGSNQDTKQLDKYRDSLILLGKKFINDTVDLERKSANYAFIKTLVSALRVSNSFNYSFDSIKSISIINAPDNKFRIFSWHIMNQDGSYRFYGTIQMNTGDKLLMYPLEDYSPLLKNPEDSVTDNHKWYGAQYYKITGAGTPAKPYYVLLGWKGNTVKSTKKVIDVLSFGADAKPVLGMPVFDGNSKTRKRVIFEYTRQASMLLRYIPGQQLIVFDHLSPPDKKMKDQPETFGPDLSYDGYQLKNGKWAYVENLDMRNIPEDRDVELVDPKKQALIDKSEIPATKRIKQ